MQDHAKIKLRYELGPALKVSCTFGLWQNSSDGAARSYLQDGTGSAVYSGNVRINGLAYAAASGNGARLSAGDFPLTRERLSHTMQALSLTSATGGRFDWEAAGGVHDSHLWYRGDHAVAPAAGPPRTR